MAFGITTAWNSQPWTATTSCVPGTVFQTTAEAGGIIAAIGRASRATRQILSGIRSRAWLTTCWRLHECSSSHIDGWSELNDEQELFGVSRLYLRLRLGCASWYSTINTTDTRSKSWLTFNVWPSYSALSRLSYALQEQTGNKWCATKGKNSIHTKITIILLSSKKRKYACAPRSVVFMQHTTRSSYLTTIVSNLPVFLWERLSCTTF